LVLSGVAAPGVPGGVGPEAAELGPSPCGPGTGAGLPALLCFAGCFGRWPETSMGGSGPWRGFVCSACGAVCAATGLIAKQVIVSRAEVERKKHVNAQRRPRSRPRLLTGTTQRPEGDTQPVTAAFWSFCPPASPSAAAQRPYLHSTPGHPAPTRTRVTYCRRQVSWLAGLYLQSPSRDAISQWTF
jgi:hypothetical protein